MFDQPMRNGVNEFNLEKIRLTLILPLICSCSFFMLVWRSWEMKERRFSQILVTVHKYTTRSIFVGTKSNNQDNKFLLRKKKKLSRIFFKTENQINTRFSHRTNKWLTPLMDVRAGWTIPQLFHLGSIGFMYMFERQLTC